MRLCCALAMLLSCSQPEPGPTTTSASASAAPLFDIHGFCDETIAVGRPCEGDDELLEGNKIGLCTTTLDEARREDIVIDPALVPACIDEVNAGKPLPDLRTLETLVARFPACRKLLAPIPALAKVEPRPAGTATEKAACASSHDCAHGLHCAARACVPKKKAGESCTSSDECLGRCSLQAKQCAAYCGSG